MKQKSFIKGASILAFSTIIAKIIGACYRIPLTNILGAEGMGIYQMVFPVFALLLTVSSGAIPSAIAIIISQKKALDKDSNAIFLSSLIFLSIVGFFLTLFLIATSKHISLLQANITAQYGYIVIAPAIFFVSITSAFRGYYIGNKNMLPPAISQIVQAIIKLLAGLFFARLFYKYGLAFAVTGALLGVTISEITTLIILFVMFDRKQGMHIQLSLDEVKKNTSSLIRVALPLTIGSIIIPLSLFFDSIIIVNTLHLKQSLSSATVDYGIFSGTVSPLINLPIVLSLSLGVTVMPILAEGKAFKDIGFIRDKCGMCLKLALIIGVPFFLLFIFLSEEILLFLYPVLTDSHIKTATILMRIESVNIIFLSLGQIVASLLQALGRMTFPVKFLVVSVSIKILLNLLLLPFIGIIGAAIASVVSFMIYAIANLKSLENLIGKSKTFVRNGSAIALSGVIMSVAVFSVWLLIANSWTLWLIIPLSIMVYLISLFAIGVFTKTELQSLPFSNIWLKLNNLFRRKKNVIT